MLPLPLNVEVPSSRPRAMSKHTPAPTAARVPFPLDGGRPPFVLSRVCICTPDLLHQHPSEVIHRLLLNRLLHASSTCRFCQSCEERLHFENNEFDWV